ncbi:glycosyltransferase family 39 protein [Thermococcus sp. LS2]|uniref:ArnT family glycosyltransferase n=1 Tax=Thermococcus sp. LS2 TaxID=1638260 RepID=UPI00143BA7ED|nr:glycosyltransferase family 39 protein [Thermococcus sp. LS2]
MKLMRKIDLKNSETRHLVILLVITLITFATVLALPVRLIEPDDNTYYVAMKAFAEGKLTLTRSEYLQFQKEVKDIGTYHFGVQYVRISFDKFALEKAPAYPFILALFHKLGLERAVNPILGLLALIVFYKFLSLVYEPRTAFFSSLILLFNATFLGMFYRSYMSDFASMVFVLIGVALYYMALERDKQAIAVLSGLSLGASVAIRYTNVVIYPAILLYALWLLKKGMKKPLRYFGLLILGSIPPAILLMTYHYIVFGSPFTAGYAYTIGYTNFAFQFMLKGEWHKAFVILQRNLLIHPKLLFEGFPLIFLLPAGLYFARRTRSLHPLAPLLLLWFLAYFGLYFQYDWLRADAYIFQTRFYLPFAPVLAASAGVLIASLLDEKTPKEIKALGYTLLGFVLLVDLSSFVSFVAHYVLNFRFGQPLLPPPFRP